MQTTLRTTYGTRQDGLRDTLALEVNGTKEFGLSLKQTAKGVSELAESARAGYTGLASASDWSRLGKGATNALAGGTTGAVLGGAVGYAGSGTLEGTVAGAESGLLHGAVGGFSHLR